MSISSTSEPDSSLITFTGSDSISASSSGGGGGIIRGRRLFLIFRSKGDDYSREAINRGTAIIRGNTYANRR